MSGRGWWDWVLDDTPEVSLRGWCGHSESIMPKSSDRGYLMGLPMKIHKILQIED